MSKYFTPSASNPFIEQIVAFQQLMKTRNRTLTEEDGLKYTKIKVIQESDHYPGKFVKIYHHALLSELSAKACKVFLVIATTLEYNAEIVDLSANLCEMDQKTFSKALLELVSYRVISKYKPGRWWVNPTIVIVGRIGKVETQVRDNDKTL
jgi:hypothetical protein